MGCLTATGATPDPGHKQPFANGSYGDGWLSSPAAQHEPLLRGVDARHRLDEK